MSSKSVVHKLLFAVAGIAVLIVGAIAVEAVSRSIKKSREQSEELVFVHTPTAHRETATPLGKYGVLPPTPRKIVREKVVEAWPHGPMYGLHEERTDFRRVQRAKFLSIPDQTFHVKAYFNDKLIAEVTHGIDDFFRRITVGEEAKKKAPRYLAAFGDSQVFGHMVKDEETLLSRLGAKEPGVRIYNYGLFGGHLGGAYTWIRAIDVDEQFEIFEPRGTILVFLSDSFLSRHFLPLGKAAGMSWRVHVAEDSNGVMQPQGPLRDFFPIRAWLSEVTGKSAFFRLISGTDSDFTPSQLEYLTKVLVAMKAEGKRLRADQFHVVLTAYSHRTRALIPYLEKAGIRYIDYTDLPLRHMVEGSSATPYVSSRSPESHAVYADEISRLRFLFQNATQPY